MPSQAIVTPSLDTLHFINTPIPSLSAKEVVIRVVATGNNPKDWKYPVWKNIAFNSGDDIAGIVHSVGSKVYEFNPGDRVAAYHEPQSDNGSYAEYAVANDWVTFHILKTTSFEEAATLPVAALTAGLRIWADLEICPPWDPKCSPNANKPLVIYGITSAAGAFAAKLAKLSGVRPIIGIAGRNAEFAKDLADYVVDYRKGEEYLISEIETVLSKEGLGKKAPMVFDAISEGGTMETTLRILDHETGMVATVLPPNLFANEPKTFAYPPGVRAFSTASPSVLMHRKDFGYVFSRFLGHMLEDGRLAAHPYEIVPVGLHGVSEGLKRLKDGQASGTKFVYRIEETGSVTYSKPPELGLSTHRLRNFPFPVVD